MPQLSSSMSDNHGHLGDIMSFGETEVMVQDGDLACFTPLQRIALTANGNLQRILAAFFNAKVKVIINKNVLAERTEHKAVFHREVHIKIEDLVCCVATSTVIITSKQILKLVLDESTQIGIGQVFRNLNILPFFHLSNIGKQDGTFYRDYILKSDGMECNIHEVFPIDLFE
jgi:chorismate-pyruvate lyase